HAVATGFVRVHSGADGALLHQFFGANPADQYGFASSFLGDVDADGHDDYAITAVFAQAAAFEAGLLEVRSGATGNLLYTRLGGGLGYWFGWSVAAAGDLDNDGFTDVITGATADPSGGPNAGAAEVWSGPTGTPLLKFTGHGQDAFLGWSVDGLGDVDGDGFDDVAAGAPLDSTTQTEGGMVRVVSGATGLGVLDAYGTAVGGHFGTAIAGPGDVDGDGRADLFVGAPDDGQGGLPYGAVWGISGRDGSVFDVVQSTTGLLTDLGDALAAVGDVDQDGVSDLLAGAPVDAGAAQTAGAARLYSGACFNLWSYGSGSPGSGGRTPVIRSIGSLPRIGSGAFRLEIADALGGAPCLLLIGAGSAAQATPWGSLLVDPNQPLVSIDIPLGGQAGVPGAGGVLLAPPIPSDLGLVGATVHLQVLVGDAVSSGGIAHSAGLRLTVCR
ncbi:MAG: integrin alpha, partial [Planctomycetota bacterium JB042]